MFLTSNAGEVRHREVGLRATQSQNQVFIRRIRLKVFWQILVVGGGWQVTFPRIRWFKNKLKKYQVRSLGTKVHTAEAALTIGTCRPVA